MFLILAAYKRAMVDCTGALLTDLAASRVRLRLSSLGKILICILLEYFCLAQRLNKIGFSFTQLKLHIIILLSEARTHMSGVSLFLGKSVLLCESVRATK